MEVVEVQKKVPEILLQHLDIPYMEEPITVEDLILHIITLEDLVEQCNMDKQAIADIQQ